MSLNSCKVISIGWDRLKSELGILDRHCPKASITANGLMSDIKIGPIMRGFLRWYCLASCGGCPSFAVPIGRLLVRPLGSVDEECNELFNLKLTCFSPFPTNVYLKSYLPVRRVSEGFASRDGKTWAKGGQGGSQLTWKSTRNEVVVTVR